MGKIYRKGVLDYSLCDVCGEELQVKKTETSKIICKKCGSVIITVMNKFNRHNPFWETLEVGYLVLLTYKPIGKKKFAKHIDGNIQNNSLDNLEWSNKPDFGTNNFEVEDDLGF